jgi:serine phosphatase RsbU (regulator of sigma subunit)
MFLDIAGERNRALDIAAAVQDCAHEHARGLFGAPDVNESEAVAQLSLLINRTVLAEAEGVCLSPAFVACYNRDIGTLAYVNAGHTPGLLRDSGSITSLAATGLPFGLFSHSPYEAEIRALEPGAALLLVSRGLVEAGSKKRQFGLERVQQTFSEAKAGSAKELCAAILQGVEKYAAGSSDQNDMTTVALVRPA